MQTTEKRNKLLKVIGLSDEACKLTVELSLDSKPGQPFFWQIKMLATPEQMAEMQRRFSNALAQPDAACGGLPEAIGSASG